MKELELMIGKVMLAGAVAAAAITFIGAIFFLIHHGAEPSLYHIFDPARSHVENYFSARGIIAIGLYILVLTQLVRVALTGWLFVKQGDKWFVIFTLFILAVLIFSLFA